MAAATPPKNRRRESGCLTSMNPPMRDECSVTQVTRFSAPSGRFSTVPRAEPRRLELTGPKAEGLLKIGDEVFGVFEPDVEPHESIAKTTSRWRLARVRCHHQADH